MVTDNKTNIELRQPREAKIFGLRILKEILEKAEKKEDSFYDDYENKVKDLISAIRVLQVKKGDENKSKRIKATKKILGVFRHFYFRVDMETERKTILNWKSKKRKKKVK